MVEIAGMRLLYTGDYSRLPDRHLSAADLPEMKPDIGAILLMSVAVSITQHLTQHHCWILPPEPSHPGMLV